MAFKRLLVWFLCPALCFTRMIGSLFDCSCGETLNHQTSNALVICNEGPPGPGNSRDFDFWSSKSPLKAPPCGDCLLVKPLLFSPAAYYFFIHSLFFIHKAHLGYFRHTAVAKLWPKPRSFPWLSPTLPGHGGGGGGHGYK